MIFFYIFRPSYHSGTVTWSCSGPPCPAATGEMCSWSRRNSELWPFKEKSWPASTSCSLSTDRSSSAGRGRGRGTASKSRPLRPGSDKGRKSAGGWRWSALSYLRTVEQILIAEDVCRRLHFINSQLCFIFQFMVWLFYCMCEFSNL